jgi:hypothetical protein
MEGDAAGSLIVGMWFWLRVIARSRICVFILAAPPMPLTADQPQEQFAAVVRGFLVFGFSGLAGLSKRRFIRVTRTRLAVHRAFRWILVCAIPR